MPQQDWTRVCLSDNPFVSTPPMPWDEVVWADMVELKRRITKRIHSALSTSPSNLVLNYGPWGGGKTHAARYFSQKRVLQSIADDVGVEMPLSLIINLPRGATKVTRAIYSDIIDSIGLETIASSISQVADALGDKFEDVVRSLVRGKEFASAIALLVGRAEEHQRQNSLFPDRALPPEIKRYFLGNATTADLKTLNLSRKVETSGDMVALLSAIFNLLLLQQNEKKPAYSEIILWFDEMEEIISLPGKEQATLTSLIRDLTDFVPANLTMFVNFTPRAGGKIEEVSSYLSDAVWSRFRERIEFFPLDSEETRKYIIDLLNAPKYRPEELKRECPDPIYPFDEVALQLICEEFAEGGKFPSSAVPRYINEVCSLVIERAIGAGIFEDEEARITAGFVLEMAPEIEDVLQYK